MSANPYAQRVDDVVHSAGPVRLILLLNRALCDRIAGARIAVQSGEIRTRASEISRAIAIIGELSQCLAPSADPDLSLRLRQIYSFLLDRLLEANVEQAVAPLEEALRVAEIMSGAWSDIESLDVPPLTSFAANGAEAARLSLCG